MTWKLRILALLAPALLVACGGGAPEEASETTAARRADAAAAREAHYASQPSLPPAVREAYERGEISQEALDARIDAGEFEPFFVTATPAEIPADLTWEDGSQLPEFSAPDARKGGTLQGAIQDFPRTLRRVGPDSNGSFRPYILDDVVMGFGQRHPVLNDI
ncbi:MAG: hypothetical protein V2I63_11605, partial [Pseudomonadales bacterium]|nr:hypothetical protein [Pseudomonadales bacterium]